MTLDEKKAVLELAGYRFIRCNNDFLPYFWELDKYLGTNRLYQFREQCLNGAWRHYNANN